MSARVGGSFCQELTQLMTSWCWWVHFDFGKKICLNKKPSPCSTQSKWEDKLLSINRFLTHSPLFHEKNFSETRNWKTFLVFFCRLSSCWLNKRGNESILFSDAAKATVYQTEAESFVAWETLNFSIRIWLLLTFQLWFADLWPFANSWQRASRGMPWHVSFPFTVNIWIFKEFLKWIDCRNSRVKLNLLFFSWNPRGIFSHAFQQKMEINFPRNSV